MTPLELIEKDLDWREAEMAVFRIMLSDSGMPERQKLVLFRAGWALLYAHYEGYCKFALTVYYDSIRSSGKLTEQLLSPAQAFALDSALRKLRGLPPVDLLCAIKTFDADHLKRPATFPDVDTESNLWPNVLNQLLEIAGLKIDYIDQNWHKIRTLVARRNKIAHGERDMIKELDYFLSFEEIIRNLMIEVAIRIDEKLCEIS